MLVLFSTNSSNCNERVEIWSKSETALARSIRHVIAFCGKCFALGRIYIVDGKTETKWPSSWAWLRRTISSSAIRLGFGTNLFIGNTNDAMGTVWCHGGSGQLSCYWYIAQRIINWRAESVFPGHVWESKWWYFYVTRVRVNRFKLPTIYVYLQLHSRLIGAKVEERDAKKVLWRTYVNSNFK